MLMWDLGEEWVAQSEGWDHLNGGRGSWQTAGQEREKREASTRVSVRERPDGVGSDAVKEEAPAESWHHGQFSWPVLIGQG